MFREILLSKIKLPVKRYNFLHKRLYLEETCRGNRSKLLIQQGKHKDGNDFKIQKMLRHKNSGTRRLKKIKEVTNIRKKCKQPKKCT